MKLGIIIDTDLRIPPFTGVTYRLYYLSKKLAEQGIDVSIFLCNRNIARTSDLNMLCDSSNLRFHVIPQRVFYNPEIMFRILDNSGVDILQFEDAVSVLRYKNIFLKLKIPVCLELHDIEMSLRKSLGQSVKEVNRSLIITKEAVKLSDAVVCMTPRDLSELRKFTRTPLHKMFLVPNPIDVKEFPAYGLNIDELTILFLGNMYYWPNLHAAEYIIKNIVDKVVSSNSRAKFIFIGAISKNNINRLKKDNVLFTGRVNKLNKYLKRTTLALCPVTAGSGMKVKVLCYCSSALPVVTTRMGYSGYEHIKSLIVKDDLSSYPEIIIRLLKNQTTLKKLGALNRKYVEEYYDIGNITKKMIRIYRDLFNSGPHEKHFCMGKFIPPPLWLNEDRINRIRNNNYYIIQHGKIISKKSFTADADC